MTEISPTSRIAAERLDSNDPLASFRDEFVIDDDSVCYLDGNSLGRLPRATIDLVHSYLKDEWGSRLVDGWNDWIDEAQSTGDLIGRAALGAAPGQVLAVDTTSAAMQARLDAVKWEMLDEWARTRRAPQHAAWLHEPEFANVSPG